MGDLDRERLDSSISISLSSNDSNLLRVLIGSSEPFLTLSEVCVTLAVLALSLVVFGAAFGAAIFGAALGAATFGAAMGAAAFGASLRFDLDSDTDVCLDAAVALIPEPDATAVCCARSFRPS